MDTSFRPPMLWRQLRWRHLMPCALVALVLATSGCGGQRADEAQWVTGDPQESVTPSDGVPSASASPDSSPTTVATASPSRARPTTPGAPAAAADRTAPTISGAAISEGATIWYVLQGVHQTGCGEPTTAAITATVKDAVGVARVWFEYEARTKAPLRGEGTLTATGDRAAGRYRGTLGPFAADSRNASGGSINIVLHAADAAGNQSSTRLTAQLLSCQRQG